MMFETRAMVPSFIFFQQHGLKVYGVFCTSQILRSTGCICGNFVKGSSGVLDKVDLFNIGDLCFEILVSIVLSCFQMGSGEVLVDGRVVLWIWSVDVLTLLPIAVLCYVRFFFELRWRSTLGIFLSLMRRNETVLVCRIGVFRLQQRERFDWMRCSLLICQKERLNLMVKIRM